MANFDKNLRRGLTRFLDYDTQRALLQREQDRQRIEKEHQAQADQQRAANEQITKLALNLQSPAGVEATRRILGGGFDTENELNFRRLQAFMPEGLKSEQYGALNPVAAKVGLGQFVAGPLSTQRVLTEAQRGEAAKALAEQRRSQKALDVAESRARISKINSDLKNNKAKFAKTITDLIGKVSQGNASNKDFTNTITRLDKVEKDYTSQLEELQSQKDYLLDPDTGEPLTDLEKVDQAVENPKYADIKRNLEENKRLAQNKKNQIYSAILGSTGDAEKVDQATGGAVAGNAADNLRNRLAMELLKSEFPQLASQLAAQQSRPNGRPLLPGQIPGRNAQLPESPVNEFERQLMERILGKPQQTTQQIPTATLPQTPQQIIQTPDGMHWRVNPDGTFTQVQ